MNTKTDFQVRVLKKYGVIPVFEGDPGYTNVKTSLPGETYKQWCSRIIGKNNDEVSLYCLYQPKGNERIGRLGRDGDYLKKIFQAQSRKSYLKGRNQSNPDEVSTASDDWINVGNREISRDEVYDTLADAVPERSEAIDQFFEKFADQNAGKGDWVNLFESLAVEYVKLTELYKNKSDNTST